MRIWDTIVIGAGISGLTSAFTLARAGFRVLVLERQDAVGGRARSERVDGFLMEHGPSSLVSPAAGADGLIAAAGLAGEMVFRSEAVRHRYLVRGSRVQGLALSPLRFFMSPFFTLRGRARLMLEPLMPRKAEDETVAAWVERRFGHEMLDYVFDPLVGGLLAGRPEALSMDAAFPQLKRMEREAGSVMRAVARRRWRRSPAGLPGARTLFSFRDGIAALPRSLARQLAGNIRLGLRAVAVQPAVGGGFLVKAAEAGETGWEYADSVVVALPAYAAAELLDGIRPHLAQRLAAIPHPPLSLVFQGYRRRDIEHPLDGLGFLTPAVERRQALGVLFSSTMFPDRAPDGRIALTTFIGGDRQPHLALLPDAALAEIAREEARMLLSAHGNPVISRIRRWRAGLPQPGPGHGECVRELRQLETDLPGLFVTGNYIAGVSTVACIDNGIATAERAVRHLAACPARTMATAV